MSKTIQTRLSDSEFEKLQAVVAHINEGGWEKTREFRDRFHQPGYGKITISDVVRAMIAAGGPSSQAAVLQPRSRERNTTSPAARNTKHQVKRNTKSRRSPGKRNTSPRSKRNTPTRSRR